MILQGRAVCLGADVDTDLIIAGRYLRTKDRRVWAEHVFEDLDPALAARMEGAVILAGTNFGCGSSREQAPVALREAGVAGVIAPSFARIFFRNAINVGLPVVECGGVRCSNDAPVSFSPDEGWVEAGGERCTATPLSGRMLDILAHGGLVEYWRAQQ
ncbi:MAG: 3-isopropylmalate dehydratase [Methanomicrobiaceae archaeon]|nr:3-isopropylmalate dehydratase [Methanomicrobiaceae archaeon]